MAEEHQHPATRKSLQVLPHSGKTEQLRKELAESPRPRNLANENVIDRALDNSLSPQQKALREKVIEATRTVYDPEIPVNIYDLGLIYEISISEENEVFVKMTLTAPGCPVAGSLPPEVEQRIEAIPEVKSARVELVWDPPWTKDRMSEAAMLELGLM